MSPEDILAILTSVISLQLLVKVAGILFMLLHLAFSIVVYRQTQVMNHVVEAQISPAISIVALIHLIFSVFVLLWVVFLV